MEEERENQALVKAEPDIHLGTLQATDAQGLVDNATNMASVLANVIDKQKLYVTIHKRKYVLCEGWTTLIAMLGIVPREVSNIEHEDGSCEARVELVRMSDGVVVSQASALVGMDEPTWADRPRYARKSMAATRATGKACRLSFSWIMKLAGYEPTPAEEIPQEDIILEGPQQAQFSEPRGKKVTPQRVDVITEKQAKRLYAIARSNGWTGDQLNDYCRSLGYEDSRGVPWGEYDEVVEYVGSNPAPSDTPQPEAKKKQGRPPVLITPEQVGHIADMVKMIDSDEFYAFIGSLGYETIPEIRKGHYDTVVAKIESLNPHKKQ